MQSDPIGGQRQHVGTVYLHSEISKKSKPGALVDDAAKCLQISPAAVKLATGNMEFFNNSAVQMCKALADKHLKVAPGATVIFKDLLSPDDTLHGPAGANRVELAAKLLLGADSQWHITNGVARNEGMCPPAVVSQV